MASPLTPAKESALNSAIPPSERRRQEQSQAYFEIHEDATASMDSDNSSPMMSPTPESDSTEKENPMPPPSAVKARPQSRIISGNELSPLKILQDRPGQQPSPPIDENAASAQVAPPSTNPLSPRKLSSPIRRFPVKINVGGSHDSSLRTNSRPSSIERPMSLDEAIRDNPALQHAIDLAEDDSTVLHDDEETQHQVEDKDSVSVAVSSYRHEDIVEEPSGIDDSMMSDVSSFSAVPNLAMLNQMRNSPSKFSMGESTPRARPSMHSRTPTNGSSGNTTNLMDFTDQLRYGAYAQPNAGISPSRTVPNLAGAGTVAATPTRNNLVNLLDFDIPPMPTPRSMPTITPRELESLKSGFLSEISGLKATLSGKEAEVASLKTAVGDAEKRVGECMETLREVQGLQETLKVEKDSWEKRGREMESVLRSVKEEIVITQREREDLEFKLDESEKRCQAAEMMAQDAESKMAGMRAGKASADAAAAAGGSSPNGMKSPVPGGSNKEVEMAVERVARELHALYKSKHEAKVTALKKSYENRWEKKVRELRDQVEELSRENEELRIGRDATMTRLDPVKMMEIEEERKLEKAKDAAHIRELEAECDKLNAVIGTIQGDNNDLRGMLEKERVEKGELVQLAEEMMQMQTLAPEPAPAPAPAPETRTTPSRVRAPTPTMPKTATKTGNGGTGIALPTRTTPTATRYQDHGVATSTKRTSMLRAPTGLRPPVTESRIGRMTHERTRSNGLASGLMAPRSGIMNSIEKMGNYRGRGD